jgi:hypothetical protein
MIYLSNFNLKSTEEYLPGDLIARLVLPGSIRSKKNSKRIIPMRASKKTGWMAYFRAKGGRRILLSALPTMKPSTAYEKWEKNAREYTRIQILKNKDLPIGDIKIHVLAKIYYKGKKPDLSGAYESIGDCLEGYIWANDSQIESWDGSRLIHDLRNPRTEIEVRIWNNQ